MRSAAEDAARGAPRAAPRDARRASPRLPLASSFRSTGDRSPTLSQGRRRHSLDGEEPGAGAAPSPRSGADVEAGRRRRSPSPGPYSSSPDARAPLRPGSGALLSPKGGGPAPASPRGRGLWPLAAAALATLLLLGGFAADRRAAAPRPRCSATYGLRPWGEPRAADNWRNVTIDIDLAATGNVPFYAPYEVALSDGAYLRVLKTWNLNVTRATAYSRVAGTVGNWWMHLQPGGRPLGLGLTVEVWQGDGAPRALTVNGVQCTLARRAAPPPGPPPALRSEGGRLVDADTGEVIYMAGINYMGYEYGLTMFDGIGQAFKSTTSLSQDLATVAWRMRLLGVNAVRLPFDFRSVMTRAADAAQLPCYSVPPGDVVAASTDPTARRAHASAGAVLPPPPPPEHQSRPGWCNERMPPAESLLDRFLWVVDFFAANGFYVVLDNQFNYDTTATDDVGLWVAQWRKLWTEMVARYPASSRRVLLDVLNEPDVWGLGWQAVPGNASLPAAGDLYLEAMDALHEANPGTLFIVQGCGQPGVAKNWGDGLATDPALLARFNASDPRPFFEALVRRPYARSVVLGPHVYPPSVYDVQRTNPEGDRGETLFSRLTHSFGYLNKRGYCPRGGGECTVFPIVLGETGTGFVDPRDWQAQIDLAEWSAAAGRGADGAHGPVAGVFWWAWGLGHGADGPDHPIDNDMGVVGRDWASVDWKKVRFLQRFGFQPWYAPGKRTPGAAAAAASLASDGDD